MRGFKAHGEFKIQIDGRIVVIEAEGPFNIELTQSFGPVAAEFTERMRGAPWGVLVIADGDFLLTPEAEEAMREAEARYEDGGRRVTAFVIGGAPWSQIVRSQWQRVYANNARQPQFFDDLSSARDWLLAELTGLEEAQ